MHTNSHLVSDFVKGIERTSELILVSSDSAAVGRWAYVVSEYDIQCATRTHSRLGPTFPDDRIPQIFIF